MSELATLARVHAWLDAHPGVAVFKWMEPGVPHADLMALVQHGDVVKAVGWNPRHEIYRLKGMKEPPPAPPLELTQYAEQDEPHRPRFTPIPERTIRHLFDDVVGYDDMKRIISGNIRRRTPDSEPVHHALDGPPASAKSMIADAFLTLPHSAYVQGAAASRSGISALLMNEEPEWLVIDEAPELDAKDQTILLGLCEDGHITETFGNRRIEKRLNTVVIITGNDLRKRMAKRIISRFGGYWPFQSYDRRQFISIVRHILHTREEFTLQTAEYIGSECWKAGIRDVRSVRGIARMCPDYDEFKAYLRIQAQQAG